MYERLEVKCYTTKLLEEKKNLEDLGLSKEFLDLTPKSLFINKKKKKDKLDHSKLKLFVLRKRL